MSSTQLSGRSILVRIVFVPDAESDAQEPDQQDQRTLLLGVEAWDGLHAWYRLVPNEDFQHIWPRDGYQHSLDDFEEKVGHLQKIPWEEIYPEYPASRHLTRFDETTQTGSPGRVWFKAPCINRPIEDGNVMAAIHMLREAEAYEKILAHPHPNLASYLGCVVSEGRIVRLALPKYGCNLLERYHARQSWSRMSSAQKGACVDEVAAAAAHLHSLGLAHNDISPTNIMFFEGRAILIDLKNCAALGRAIDENAGVDADSRGGWRPQRAGGPVSSTESDELAVLELRRWLGENFDDEPTSSARIPSMLDRMAFKNFVGVPRSE